MQSGARVRWAPRASAADADIDVFLVSGGTGALTEKQLRERGVFRSLDEIEGDVREMVARSIVALPVGIVGREPAGQVADEESEVLRRGGLTPEVYEGGRRRGYPDQRTLRGDGGSGRR